MRPPGRRPSTKPRRTAPRPRGNRRNPHPPTAQTGTPKPAVRLVWTAMIGAHAVGRLLRVEQARGPDEGALGMRPLGLDRVAPRTLDGRIAGQDGRPLSLLLHRAVMRADPAAR